MTAESFTITNKARTLLAERWLNHLVYEKCGLIVAPWTKQDLEPDGSKRQSTISGMRRAGYLRLVGPKTSDHEITSKAFDEIEAVEPDLVSYLVNCVSPAMPIHNGDAERALDRMWGVAFSDLPLPERKYIVEHADAYHWMAVGYPAYDFDQATRVAPKHPDLNDPVTCPPFRVTSDAFLAERKRRTDAAKFTRVRGASLAAAMTELGYCDAETADRYFRTYTIVTQLPFGDANRRARFGVEPSKWTDEMQAARTAAQGRIVAAQAEIEVLDGVLRAMTVDSDIPLPPSEHKLCATPPDLTDEERSLVWSVFIGKLDDLVRDAIAREERGEPMSDAPKTGTDE